MRAPVDRARRVGSIVKLSIVIAAALWAAASPASAQALQLSTQPSLYPAFDSAVTDYVTRCASGTPVEVTVSAPAGTTVDVDRHGPRSGDFTTAVGLNPGQAFSVVSAGDTAGTYYIRCLPADFPGWTFQRTGTPQAEWYLVSPFGRTDFGAVLPNANPTYGMVFDANGVPVWWYKSGLTTLDFKLLQDGNIAWAHLNATAEERRLDGSLARTISPPPGAGLDPHELLQLPSGNYLMSVDRGLPGQTVCGQSNLTIGDNGFEEITPDGSLVRSWWASDHIPLSEVPDAWCNSILTQPAAGPSYDPYHINSVEPDGDGFVMSFRHLDAVYRVQASDGAVVWKLGGVTRPESLTVLNDPLGDSGDLFRGQHDARILPDGTLTVHDNGFHPGSTRPPRAARFAIDPAAKTATLIEQLNDPGTVATPLCCGSVRRLPGGDWVMNWGSAGLTTELDSTGARVFSLTFDDNAGHTMFSYRAHPVLAGVLSRAALRAGMDVQFPRGYPRTKGAPWQRMPLVPAFNQCASPDRTHGAPLAFDSCSSPSTSSLLTIGTPDANGQSANSVGYVAYNAILGDPSTAADEADMKVKVGLSDVRRKSDLSDYTGELQARGSIRITDRLNGTNEDEAATMQDTELPVTVPCVGTDATSVGATCTVVTTFDAILPGTVVEGKRATWQIGPAQVFDGGTSETAGASDAQLFEDQGVFVP
jgi:Arylsulfotransferase (ASST)